MLDQEIEVYPCITNLVFNKFNSVREEDGFCYIFIQKKGFLDFINGMNLLYYGRIRLFLTIEGVSFSRNCGVASVGVLQDWPL